MSLEPTAFIPAVGVDYALLQLRLQQAYTTEGPDRPSQYWRDCFAPSASAASLEQEFSETPEPAFAARAAEVLEARAAEQRGDTPSHGCPHCGDMFFSEKACKSHQRTCTMARIMRKRPAASRPKRNNTSDPDVLVHCLRKMRVAGEKARAAEHHGPKNPSPAALQELRGYGRLR